MSSEKLSSAIMAVKSGDKATGRRLLTEILKDEPSNEIAWIWLATCVEEVERKRFCLKKAISINPDNRTYQKALENLELSTNQNMGEPQSTLLTKQTPSEIKLGYDEGKPEITLPELKTAIPPAESSSSVKVLYQHWAAIYFFMMFLAAIVLVWILIRWSVRQLNHRCIR